METNQRPGYRLKPHHSLPLTSVMGMALIAVSIIISFAISWADPCPRPILRIADLSRAYTTCRLS